MNYTNWREYFELNRSHFEDIDWNQSDSLSENEKKLIRSSLQQFQKGENSEGKHLFSYAKSFPDPEYLQCIRLFICEEQKHAKVLGRFMEIHSIPRITGHWVDKVFRMLRVAAGLENTITVLLTAEIISKIYYKALRNAVSSPLLQKLCNQILKDEDMHISFQCFTLHSFYRNKTLVSKLINQALHFSLMSGTIIIVWLYHYKVLTKGGYSFRRFFIDTLTVFFEALKSVKNGIVENEVQQYPVSA